MPTPRPNRLRQLYKAPTINVRNFDGIHAGKRAFVIGGGPSIRGLIDSGYDFKKLEKEITYGVNNAYKLVVPTYLVFGDAYFWKHFQNDIKRLDCYKVIPNNIIRGWDDGKTLQLRRAPQPAILPTSLANPVSFLNNSGVAALRIAYAMGCNPIYLIGIDVGYKSDDQTHFHDDYTSRNLRSTTPTRYKQFYIEFERTLKAMKLAKREIVSCSEISELNKIIPYIPLQEVTKE